DKTGYRLATSVSGLVTGEGGDFIVCIPEGYTITTDDGALDIRDIVDYELPVKILSYNHETEQTEFKEIEAYEQRVTEEIIEIGFRDGKILECTPDHLVYVRDQGYKKAELLEDGELVLYKRLIHLETRTVKSIKRKSQRRIVYNIRIADNHNYFVNGILTHNCDDPHNVKQAESEAVRKGTLRWWDESMSTRGNNPKTVVKVVDMQRLHEADLTGHWLEKSGEDVVHLILPARFEKENKCITVIGFEDPRTEEGEPLWKNLYDEESLSTLEKDLGSEYAIAGQLQQRPSPRGGGLFAVENFSFVDSIPPSEIIRTVRYWDKGGTEDGAFTGGCKMHKMKNNSFIVEHLVSGLWKAPKREQMIKNVALNDGRATIVGIEQEPGSGGLESADNTVKNLAGFAVKKDKVTGDKVLRAEPYATQIEIGNVYLLRGAWNTDFIKQHELFPMGLRKDFVDCSSGAFNLLNGKGRAGTWGSRK
ncbi:MAG: hypothetical protein HOG49_16635, partial [Candidatus Scalindua sp.]|nr:hypothetical protein [Candidatus Scalindua sp.]